MSNISALSLEAAERFVQTAIVVDNEAGFGPMANWQAPRVAQKAAKPSVGGKDTPANDTDAPVDGEETDSEADDSHYLDMKALGETFMEREIVCAAYRPEVGDEMINATIKAASTADIAIIDWQLEGEAGGSTRAKEIIAALLTNDADTGPRLRLIAIYTGQKDLQNLSKELLRYIHKVDALQGFAPLEDDATIIDGPFARVVFINKERTFGAIVGERKASEAELPEMLLQQYAYLACGILPSTAMVAIAEVRHATPHLLTVFHQGLDGAYVGHRAMIPVAEDAESFLRRLISEELDAVIETAGTVPHYAGKQAIEQWLENLEGNGHKFNSEDGRECSSELVKDILDHVSEDPENYEKSVLALIKEKAAGNGEKNKALYREFAQLFYPAGEHRGALLEFSRLSNLKREDAPRSRFHDDWVPILTLGTILRPIVKDGENHPGNVTPGQLLVCLQPRCDSVRIAPDNGRTFPFLLLTPDGDKYRFVLRSDGEDRTYQGYPYLYNSALFDFAPKDVAEPFIKAELCDGQFIFTDINGNTFEWVADMKDLQAQNVAGQIGARAASVGYDEHEWLRFKNR